MKMFTRTRRPVCRDGGKRLDADQVHRSGTAGSRTLATFVVLAMSIAAQAHAQTSPNAVALIRQANNGNPQAENTLAVDYEYGDAGLPRNLAKSIYWLKRAAKQGYAPAENNLGLDYEDGEGVSKNLSKSAYWFGQCAAKRFFFCAGYLHHVQQMEQRATVAAPQHVIAAVHAVSRHAADNQRLVQSLQSFWNLYFKDANAQLVDFGAPALVSPVSFGRGS